MTILSDRQHGWHVVEPESPALQRRFSRARPLCSDRSGGLGRRPDNIIGNTGRDRMWARDAGTSGGVTNSDARGAAATGGPGQVPGRSWAGPGSPERMAPPPHPWAVPGSARPGFQPGPFPGGDAAGATGGYPLPARPRRVPDSLTTNQPRNAHDNQHPSDNQHRSETSPTSRRDRSAVNAPPCEMEGRFHRSRPERESPWAVAASITPPDPVAGCDQLWTLASRWSARVLANASVASMCGE